MTVFISKIQLNSSSLRFFALLVPEGLFNNGAELLDEALLVLGTFLNIEENDICFFFGGSDIFLNANNVREAFVFVTCNCEIITRYGMIEIFRDKQNEF